MTKSRGRSRIRLLGYLSLAATLLFIITMTVCTAATAGRLDIYLPENTRAEDFYPESDIVEIRTDPYDDNHMIVVAKGRGRGKVFISNEDDFDRPGEVAFKYVNVLPGGIIFDMTNGNYSGFRYLTLIVQVYVFTITILLAASFAERCRSELFSYNTLFFGGVALFLISLSADMLVKILFTMNDREGFTMEYVYSMLKNSGARFMLISAPVMAVFAVSLAVSNISLIKHEGRCFVNMLGLILSVLIIGGYIIYFILNNSFNMGSEKEVRLYDTIKSVFFTGFVYFEDMLLSASICGVIAAKKKPSFDKTHIIILGCGLADDGTPLPLLRGRIDRAIAFSEEQKSESGREISFVPSGGQGSDEIISEAESIRDYLVSKGIPEDRIILENRSTDTQENMRFSLEKILSRQDDPRVIFSTSDYHVLRSGMISRDEGIDAEGIGCKTRWYFWPNAFVREFVGLLVSKLRQHFFWIVFFIVIFATINMIMPM